MKVKYQNAGLNQVHIFDSLRRPFCKIHRHCFQLRGKGLIQAEETLETFGFSFRNHHFTEPRDKRDKSVAFLAERCFRVGVGKSYR